MSPRLVGHPFIPLLYIPETLPTGLVQSKIIMAQRGHHWFAVWGAGHFVLQIEEEHGQNKHVLTHRRPLPQRALELGPPLFNLAGLAIGNGLTDPRTQACD